MSASLARNDGEIWDNKSGPEGAINTIRSLSRSLDPTKEEPEMNPTRICSIDECSKPVKCRGLCRQHYERAEVHGCSIEGCERPGRLKRSMCNKHYEEARVRGDFKPLVAPIDRFYARLVAMPSGCIEFHGHTNHGYGVLKINKKNVRAHRFAWELENGPIPDGMIICHHCDNPPCCNVKHLFLGTDADNVADKIAKERDFNRKKTHCPQGHEYTEANTYSYATGRRCRTCHLAYCARRDRRITYPTTYTKEGQA